MARLCLVSDNEDLMPSSSFLSSSYSFSRRTSPSFLSSISLALPSRLLEFLNAPPEIEPPGLSCSPSRVTILKEYLYFLAILVAESILSATRVRPNIWFIRPAYFASYSTRDAATPMMPSSLSAPPKLPGLCRVIASRGRKVALPSLFSLSQVIVRFAAASLSVTIFWMAPPIAVSTAVSYLGLTLIMSATTPIIPASSFLCSIIRFTALPYPSYFSAIFISELSVAFAPRITLCLSDTSFSFFALSTVNFSISSFASASTASSLERPSVSSFIFPAALSY